MLLSDQWGSLFTDSSCSHISSHHGDITDEDVNVIDSAVKQHKEERPLLRELDTFWGNMIQKYSTIAIPRIDFIAGEGTFPGWTLNPFALSSCSEYVYYSRTVHLFLYSSKPLHL